MVHQPHIPHQTGFMGFRLVVGFQALFPFPLTDSSDVKTPPSHRQTHGQLLHLSKFLESFALPFNIANTDPSMARGSLGSTSLIVLVPIIVVPIDCPE